MLKRTKSLSESVGNYIVKRKKLKHSSVDIVRKYLTSDKGEVIQALYMVFDSESFSFETLQRNISSFEFVTFLNLEGYTFIGYGKTKITSRSCSVRIALLYLFDELDPSSLDFLRPSNITIINTEPDYQFGDLANSIASLVLRKYEELKSDHSNFPWFKVLSGIVMIRNNDYKNGNVVVLSTGSKCIEPKNIPTDGSVILDSHAEILSRRAFKLFLYTQIELFEIGSESIMSHNGNKYEIKKDVALYLYVSSAPCGDCRIFTVSDRNNIDKHPNRICRGVLRIKLDGSNTTVPITKYASDERLKIMSCSDKLLKINVLGLQGSLLSNFVEPVYLTGLVIGDSFQQSHVQRALYERIEKSEFPKPFHLNELIIQGQSKPFPSITKSPKICVNWICDNTLETTNSIKGKTICGDMSRLCKLNLLKKFVKILQAKRININSDQTYEYYKNLATDYCHAKQILYDYLEERNLGRWNCKNYVFNNFSLNSGK